MGDSITQNWERTGPEAWRDFAPIWQQFYGDRHAVNLGFKGDSTCHLLWRLRHGELDGINPRGIILLIGANNFGHVHTDAEQTFLGIQTILNEIRRRLPHAHVLLIGVLPSIRSGWVDQNTRKLNILFRQDGSIDRSHVDYVDVSDLFLKNNQVDASKFLDPKLTPPDPPLHPSAQVQMEIAERIEPFVSRILGDQLHNYGASSKGLR
jgi:lysophospholipase L1-like esterase